MRTNPLLVSGGVLLALAILAGDLFLGMRVAVGVPYAFVVLLSRWARTDRAVPATALVCTALLTAGFLLAPSGDGWWPVLANRSLALVGIWLAAGVVYLWKRSERSQREESAYVRLLHHVTEAANSEPDADGALQVCLDRICAHTGWPVGHVYRLAADGTGELAPTRIWHLDEPERFQTFRAVTERTRFAPGVGLPGRVLESGRPAWIADVTEDPNFPRARAVRDIGVRAAFGFPVRVGNEVAAVLEFFSVDAAAPNERMLEVMGQMGTQLGRVIERERSALALRASGERYQNMFHAAPVSIWEEDPSEARAALEELRAGGVTDFAAYFDEHPEFVRAAAAMVKIVDVNDATLPMTGAPDKEQLLGGLDRIYSPESHDVLKGELVAIAEGYPYFESESVNRTFQGERMETHVAVSIPRADADFRNLLVCVTDISERKRAERERTALEARMQQAQRLESMGVLAGGIAHDFNNVLGVILGNSRLALDELAPDAGLREKLEKIRVAAKHASGLTDQMLSYAGEGPADLAPLDLSRLVRELLDLLHSTVGEKCSLEVDLAPELPCVAGDPGQIRQVVLNLVTNAAEALDGQPGTVAIRTGTIEASADYLADVIGAPDPEPGPRVFLEVFDTGAGMDEATQVRIFDPFFTTKFSGRGLGLAALLGIVRRHAGSIKIDSQPGSGTTFRVLLPPEPERGAERAAPAPPAVSGQATGRILVVDDDQSMLDLMQHFLERAGFQVIPALGGRKALETFRARADEIDAVVLDLAMPEVGGEEVFFEMQRIRADLGVIFVSGYGEEEVARRLAGRGSVDFLHKPFEPEQLVKKVRAALAGKERAPGNRAGA
ncbi:MAG: response regulator [Proteobacteria bacterium]|nr:response regulator [Pseudomonadota bacterium]